MPEKILIGMSGGVDSSVAAYLLLRQGYDVTGCIMQLHHEGPSTAIEDAQKVADRLGIRLIVLDFTKEFRCEVMDRFTQEYLKGRTPNPCVDCNRTIKFGCMKDWALEHGFDKIATGHYARKVFRDGRYYIRKAADLSRDQSYVLYPLGQDALRMLELPLGELYKQSDTELSVRKIAEEQGFVNARKHDSQDICFVPDGDYAAFVEKNSDSPQEPGDFVDVKGHILGRHKGLIHYTIGQRRGLGLSVPESVYVLSKDIENNTVLVGSNDALFGRELQVRDLNWMRTELSPGEEIRANVRIRYQQKEQPALITMAEDSARIVFDEPQRAIAAGQSAVFYDDEVVIGGGVIC